MLGTLLMIVLVLLSLFMVVLILLQRGKGGGLAGAFGGQGGQSAFGTKAGDVFTKATVVTALFWIVLCAAAVKVYTGTGDRIDPGLGSELPVSDEPLSESASPSQEPESRESATPGTPETPPAEQPSSEGSPE